LTTSILKKLRFENTNYKKIRSSKLGVFFYNLYSFVTSTGFKPVTLRAEI
jgi:hypothetical protein